ncbi:cation diffusion facilitator family transporter [Nocardioides sp. Kera G14]|uniref:cation diffusion facilitator family transporter n=1 Tax=Nocardioides sp. Kera G14 TaxID=2884264 RepID=UPI001D126F91|nr:cation diffusion facilitator family transporter [Nocardioides sp. Kera G14]UDY24119.1 cation diffusion facilitator family transporter [Nocardioides sp. Kera G14]
MGHHHDHGIADDATRGALLAALALLVAFMVGEVVVAILADSLALLSDAGHMLTDAGSIAAALWAIRLAARPASERWTFGLKRAEILSAAINGITLLVVSGVVLVEAVRRLVSSHPTVSGGPVLVVAAVGCLVNVAAAWLIARANRSSLNIEGAYQHILTDLFGFVGTLIAAVVILTTGWEKADSVAALVVVVLMLRSAWSLLRDSGHILLEGTPGDLDLAEVRRHLLEVDHIVDVHDLHAWTITSGLPTLSAHLTVEDQCFGDRHTPQLLDAVQECLHDHFDVEHSTFQFEPASHAAHEHGAH